ncbi:AAA family ATPase [Nocardiopsis sp. CNT312]|uniref:AAA family ATPase n=1 Tax=Nocardiopsis sp. CNT312 TaxID=1137268 RepID=UPI00048D7B8C|nr:AAA family ATPase [Nocardiopsis sp. CNT312]
MKRFILTGAPGSGKTVLLRQLELDGYAVVEEAATDVIALARAQGRPEPWTDASFPGEVCALQRRRLARAVAPGVSVQIHDRSPVCTYALARYLGHPVPPELRGELRRIRDEEVYERRVLFVESLGFVTRTEARRVSLDEALRFERVHTDVYRELGYDCVALPAGDPRERADAVAEVVGRP